MKGIRSVLIIMILFLLYFSIEADTTRKGMLSDIELLGKKLFFDENLSSPRGQSCATCHGPDFGWSGPDSKINKETAVYPGALQPRFGNRKPPTAAYAGFSPKLHRDKEGTFVGGMFWDGRAWGHELGDPLAEQAKGPFLNPLEQNLPDEKSVIQQIQKSDYAPLFKKVWGGNALSLKEVGKAYNRVARSIAAYERSVEVNPFSSKFDDFWRESQKKGLDIDKIGKNNQLKYKGLGLNSRELKGLMLFNTKGECAECHVLTSEDGNPPLFSDFTYDNLGAPKNPNNPFYQQDKEFNPKGKKWLDLGLGDFLRTTKQFKKYASENDGKYKVPTLRNVDFRPDATFVKVFMHNGVFKSLKEVVNFYNTRDKQGQNWPPPEVSVNVNNDELGDLGLTDEEEDLIVDFMKTLSDKIDVAKVLEQTDPQQKASQEEK